MRLLVRNKAFYRRVCTIGGSVAAQQMITAGVNMMDTIMLGCVGELALAASSMANQVHNLFHFMCMGLGMGSSVLIARFWGSGNRESLRKTIALVYRFCFAIVFIYTLIVWAFSNNVMRLLTPDEAIIREGARYLLWTVPCFFLFGMSQVTTIILRSIKQVQIPLYSSIGAFFVNIFFNWVFIFGKLGAPSMDIVGAALGTLISRFFEFSVVCGFLFFFEKNINFHFQDILATCKDLLPEYLRISIPVLISDTLLGLGNSMTMAVGGRIGKSFMSALSITSVTQHLSNVFSSGLGQAAVIIIGNTLGEGDLEESQQQGITFATLGYFVGILCGIFIYSITPMVVELYNLTPQTKIVAIQVMHAMSVLMVFMIPSSVLTKGVLRGGGDTQFLMIADVIFLWVISAPLGYLAGLVWHFSPFFVFFCLRIDHVIKATWCLFRLHSRKWIKAIEKAYTFGDSFQAGFGSKNG